MSIKKRKSIRFRATPIAVAFIDLNHSNKTFKPTVTALIANESYTGCALVLVSDETFKVNQLAKVKIGDLDPLDARVVWSKTLEENIKKIGFEFQE